MVLDMRDSVYGSGCPRGGVTVVTGAVTGSLLPGQPVHCPRSCVRHCCPDGGASRAVTTRLQPGARRAAVRLRLAPEPSSSCAR